MSGSGETAGTYGLGVDLGTTYAAAALWRDERAESVPLGLRAHTVPSVLFLREDGAVLVGEAAIRRGITDPERVAREFKRRFGDGVPLFLGDREVTAEELAGQLLRWVVDTVAEREGARPAHVTLTHPASWGEHRTQLLVAAAETAGLTDVGLLPEPVAAAAYYASTERLEPGALLAVYDFGGGTFDATVVRKTRSGFAVAGTPVGDDSLGGIDVDQAVLAHVAATVGAPWHHLDTEDPAVRSALAQVREHAVAAKEALSSDVEASVPVILPGVSREVRLTRGELESAIRIPLLRTVDLLAQAIEAAGASLEEIHAALLIGGSSRIPLVSKLIAGELRIPVAVDAHPKFAVCLGAAVAAGARLSPAARPAPTPVAPEPPTGPPPGWEQPGWERPTGPPPRPADSPQPVARPDPMALRSAPVRPPPPIAARPVPPRVGAPLPQPAAVRPADSVAGPDVPAAVTVDLAGRGITEAVDTAVQTEPDPAPSWAPVLIVHDEPLTVTHLGDPRRGRRAALLTAAVALLVLAAVIAGTVYLRPSTTTGPAAGPATSASDRPAVTAAGSAALRAEPVTADPGDVMHAVASAGRGAAVAVGESLTDGVPRAWRSGDGGAWEPVEVVQAQTVVGAMRGVAVQRGQLIAVGWVAPRPAAGAPAPAVSDRRAAVWTFTDGDRWTLSGAGDLGTGAPGLGELLDVVARPGGGFLASGVDRAADPASGDGSVLTSVDGRDWQAVPATGLDGLGPTTLRRLLATDQGFTAVGARRQGGATQPAVWTSPDGVGWTEVATLDTLGLGGAEATGLTRLPDGRLLATGSATALSGETVPALWVGAGADGLAPYSTDVADGALSGVAASDGRVTAVGSMTGESDRAAAAWTVELTPMTGPRSPCGPATYQRSLRAAAAACGGRAVVRRRRRAGRASAGRRGTSPR